ncbi:MAG: HAMP domain-containing histidine kinase [Rhodospirillaceae bacterium]|nr:HAMP domain-containing histidine kinase [Rhodospirillaceae bacterium]
MHDAPHGRLKADGTTGAHGLDLARLLDAVNDAYAELETTSARLRDAIAHIGAGFAIWAPDERLTLCNDTYRHMLPSLADLMVPGTSYGRLMSAAVDRDVVILGRGGRAGWIEAGIARHRQPTGVAYAVRLRDGRIFEIRKERARDGGVVDLFTDVTRARQVESDLRHAKDQAEVANRSKSEFLANVSHELRTPLNAIIGFAEMMAGQMLGPIGLPKYQEYASDIRDSGGHLLALINDILDMARIESGRLTLHEEPVSIAVAIESCVRLVTERARRGGVTVEVAIERPTPRLHADERMVKQIVLNLLSNAVKFTLRGGKVTVEAAHCADGRVAIVTSDTGIGMTHDEIAKALTPFHRSESAFSRRFEGTGLGLPITKSLAEAHGAHLEITSRPGIGTRCAVIFPATRTLAAA